MVSITNHEVKCESCDGIVKPEGPNRLILYQTIGALLFGIVGALIGSVIGIATAGVGAPAIVPLGALGLYLGYKLGGWVARKRDGISCPECGSYFSSPSLASRALSVVQ